MERPSFELGAAMKKVVGAQKVSTEDETSARKFLEACQGYVGGFEANRNSVARELGYREGYLGLPLVLRSFISKLGAEARAQKQKAKKLLEMKQAEEKLRRTLELAESNWIDQVRGNKDFQRDMTDEEIVGPASAERNTRVLRPNL